MLIANCIRCHLCDVCKLRIIQGFFQHQINVIRRCIMIFVLKTMGIGKVSSCTAKFCSKAVHHFYKFICCSTYVFRNGRCCIIGRINKKTMKKLIHGNLISRLETSYLRTGFQGNILLWDRYCIVHVSIFQCKHSCHDLCDAGRINLVVGTFCIEYLFITEIQKHTGLAVIQTDRIQSNIFCNNTEIMGETCRALLFFGSQSIIKLGECIERICRSGKISALQHVNTQTASCA